MSDIERPGLTVESGLDSRNAFREAYAAAEVEAAKEAGLVTEEGQPRDPETGQFVAAETETPVVETEVEAEAAPAETVDERDARIAALEARLAEKDQFIGRQSSELGELRQRFDQIDERLNQPQPQHRAITPDLIDRDPASATQLAYEQGDQFALAQAFENWKIEDPAGASAWYTQQAIKAEVGAVEQRYQQKFAELEQRFSPIQAQNDEAALRASVATLPDDTRAFLANAEIVQALAAEFPTIGNTIANGTPQERIEAVRALHDIHRGRVSDTLERSTQDAAREAAEAAQAVRDDAYVASATTSGAEAKSPEQVEQERAVEAFTRRQSTWDEAFVRPAKK